MARVKYDVSLGRHGELSGDLAIVGQAREHPPSSGIEKLAIVRSFMGSKDEEPEFLENCRRFASGSFPRMKIKPYGDSSAVLITPGVFFREKGYNAREFLPRSDVVLVRKAPVVECFAPADETAREGFETGEEYRVQGYVHALMEMYAKDYRKGKLSRRMVWHIQRKMDFVMYSWILRSYERARRSQRRAERKGRRSSGIDHRMQKLERMLS